MIHICMKRTNKLIIVKARYSENSKIPLQFIWLWREYTSAQNSSLLYIFGILLYAEQYNFLCISFNLMF